MGVLDTVTRVTGSFADVAGERYGYALWKDFLNNLDNMKEAFIPGYLACFLMGHYIHEYGLGKWHRRVVYAAIPALALSAALTIWLSGLAEKRVYAFIMETNPLIFLASAGIFAFFRARDAENGAPDRSPRLTKAVVWLGAHTFGIYLIHFAVRDGLAGWLGFDVTSYPALLSVPLNSLLIFIVSLGLAVLMKKIPGVRRIVS